MGIGDRISDSFGFAQEALVGNWTRWIMLVISSIVFPVLYGYTVIVMRGEKPNYEEESFFSLFINGLKLFVIGLVYMIIPMIACIATIGYTAFSLISTGGNFSSESVMLVIGSLIGGFAITALLMIIFMLFAVIGSVRFSRTGSMAEAFALGEIVATMGKIGWVNYILSLIVLFIAIGIIIAVITVIEVVLAFIPILGWIIGWVISLLIGPFISLMASRYYSLLYDSGE